MMPQMSANNDLNILKLRLSKDISKASCVSCRRPLVHLTRFIGQEGKIYCINCKQPGHSDFSQFLKEDQHQLLEYSLNSTKKGFLIDVTLSLRKLEKEIICVRESLQAICSMKEDDWITSYEKTIKDLIRQPVLDLRSAILAADYAALANLFSTALDKQQFLNPISNSTLQLNNQLEKLKRMQAVRDEMYQDDFEDQEFRIGVTLPNQMFGSNNEAMSPSLDLSTTCMSMNNSWKQNVMNKVNEVTEEERIIEEEDQQDRIKEERDQERIKEERIKEERIKEERIKEERIKEQRIKEERIKEERIKEQRIKEERIKEERIKERIKEERIKKERDQERIKEEKIKQERLKKSREEEYIEEENIEEEMKDDILVLDLQSHLEQNDGKKKKKVIPKYSSRFKPEKSLDSLLQTLGHRI